MGVVLFIMRRESLTKGTKGTKDLLALESALEPLADEWCGVYKKRRRVINKDQEDEEDGLFGSCMPAGVPGLLVLLRM